MSSTSESDEYGDEDEEEKEMGLTDLAGGAAGAAVSGLTSWVASNELLLEIYKRWISTGKSVVDVEAKFYMEIDSLYAVALAAAPASVAA